MHLLLKEKERKREREKEREDPYRVVTVTSAQDYG